jgi:hypothetical protein
LVVSNHIVSPQPFSAACRAASSFTSTSTVFAGLMMMAARWGAAVLLAVMVSFGGNWKGYF